MDLDVRADLGDPGRALSNRLHGELATRDIGERGGDTLGSDRDLEESAAELFVGDIIVIRHRLIPSHVPHRNGR